MQEFIFLPLPCLALNPHQGEIVHPVNLRRAHRKVNFAAGKHRTLKVSQLCGYCTYSIIPVMIKCKSD